MTNTGCVPIDRPGDSHKPPDKDWFGNSLPKDDPSCGVTDGIAPPILTPPIPPPPPGWKEAKFTLEVNVKGSKAHKFGGVGDLCLPVKIHVYGTIAGLPGMKLDVGGPAPVPLPWDGIRSTPWSAFIDAQYDATKIGAPAVHIDLIATWLPEPGWGSINLPDVGVITLQCDILINGRSVRITHGWGPNNPDFAILDGKTKTAHCDLTANV